MMMILFNPVALVSKRKPRRAPKTSPKDKR